MAAALCLSLLSGCADTPENPIVKKKTGQNMEQYKEVQQPEEKEKETENQEETAQENKLASRLSVPGDVPGFRSVRRREIPVGL